MNLKEEIIQYVATLKSGFSCKLGSKQQAKRNPVLWNKVVEATSFLPEDAMPNQRYWHILHEVWHRPLHYLNGFERVWNVGIYRNSPGKGPGHRSSYGKEKAKQTCLQIYGTENPAQAQIIKDKMASTNLIKYGHKNYFGSAEGIQLVKDEWADPIKRESRLANIKKAQFENHGGWPYQKEEIFSKAMRNGFKYKPYIMPSGNIYQIQGYESHALDHLLKSGYLENDISLEKDNMPIVWYDYLGSKRRYYPDIYITKENHIIEVKSTFTYDYQIEKNLAKEKECLNQGFKFTFMIFSSKFELVSQASLKFNQYPVCPT